MLARFANLILPLALLVSPGRAAFELVAEDPWLGAGAASTLWPSSPFVLAANPAALGLLESSAISCAASRPFGLSELDRAGVSGCLITSATALGTLASLSGDRTYSEISLHLAASHRVLPQLLLGAGLAGRRLSISGYGHGEGCSFDLGAVYSPVRGLYGGASAQGLLRTGLGESGDPTVPRGFGIALGASPLEGFCVSAGIWKEELLGPEVSVMTGFAPTEALRTALALRTDPLRFSVMISFAVEDLGIAYGYSQHSALPGTHLASASWGSCACSPDVIDWGSEGDGNEATQQANTGFPLDLNSASALELEAIPGIGPSRAAAIVAFRERYGAFSRVTDVSRVPGIGPATLEKISPYLMVESP
jgi:competence ComEA-like helix-hairpin-helix protein